MTSRFRGTTLTFALVLSAACVQAGAQPSRIDGENGPVAVHTVASGLVHPWGLDFLPDGRILVTERPGSLRILSADGGISEPVAGVPDVYATGQGGLLDVRVGPNFADDSRIYLSFSEPGDGGASTAVARGRLDGNALKDVEVIVSQRPKVSGGRHFGSRLAFAPGGMLYVTTGDRGLGDPAQDLKTHIGKVLRINPDGSVPSDNPYVGTSDAMPEIWSYGHRNMQGAAVHPASGKLWIHEHGPRGGDEINVPEAGRNYGWPLVSWGRHYSGVGIPDPPTRPEFADAIYYWDPVIAASGMDFYSGDLFPSWKGNLLVGGLVAKAVVRLTLDGEKVVGEERLGLGARVRAVRSGPDGAVYVLTDQRNGKLLRLSPG